MTLPAITLQSGRDKRVAHGHPWVFSNEVQMDAHAKLIANGSMVRLLRADGKPLALAMFNPHTLIAARVLDRDISVSIDVQWVKARLSKAIRLRDRVIGAPYYRLVHAEADGFPGLIIDRYDRVISVEINCAGMEVLWPHIEAALLDLLKPQALIVSRAARSRQLEGLPITDAVVVHGSLTGPVEAREGGVIGLADPLGGQKTGWFYDQRDNRAFTARFAKGARVLDVFSYAGAFALHALAAGAREVISVDRSAAALALASEAAARNGAADRFTSITGDAFDVMTELQAAGERFDVVIADPPAFIKSKKDVATGLKGYRKVARQAASLVAPGGILTVASCSHHASIDDFTTEVARGIESAGRTGRILRTGGAAPDHPVHPQLPESAYLKALTISLD